MLFSNAKLIVFLMCNALYMADVFTFLSFKDFLSVLQYYKQI
jgi:hypothetical protein